MDAIQGLHNPNQTDGLNEENGLDTKLTGRLRRIRTGRKDRIGAVPTAAMLNGAPPTEIFPTDSEKGWRDWKGARRAGRSGTRGGGGRYPSFVAFNDQTNSSLTFYFYSPLYDVRQYRQDTIKFRTTSSPLTYFSAPKNESQFSIFVAVQLCFDALFLGLV